MANYREPQWLLPNEKNLAMPASDATVGSGLAEDRQSLYSMNFDGTTSDRISIESSDNILPLNATMSISAWIYMDTSAAGVGRTIFTNGKDNSGAYEYRFEIDTNDNLYFAVRTLSGSPYYTEIIGGTTISLNTWHHVAITWDGANLNLYLNGTSDTSPVAATSFYTSGSNDAPFIGVRRGGASSWYSPWAGKLDEIAIWNRALSASEVSALATASAPANILALSDKPVAYWPLGEQARLGSQWQFPNEVLQSQVFDFDGSTDFIDVDTISLGNTFTLSCWVNFDSFSATTGIIFGGGVSYYALYIPNSTTVWAYFNAGSSFTVPALSGWNNLIFTRNGATGELFLNGQSQGTNATYGTNDFDLKFIGCENQGGGTRYYLDGKLSNTAVWNTVLDSANIANIYNNGSPQSSYTTTPTAWYKLNATSNYAGLNPNFHNALSFDGSNDYIQLASSSTAIVDWTQPYSISLWVKYSTPLSWDLIATFGIETGSASTTRYIMIGGNSGYLFTGVGDTDGGTTTIKFDIGSGLDQGDWHHLVYVGDGTSGDFPTVYIDGVVAAPSAGTTNLFNSSTYLNVIGTGSTATGRYFPGKISNTAIFNQAISAEDVLYLYNGGTPQTSLSFEPVSWWKLDNLTTGIQDSGSASNNGTNNGATAVSSSVAVDQWNFDNVSQAQTPTYASALDFVSSSTQYIDLTNTGFPTGNSSRTMSAWIKSDSTGQNNEQGILRYGTKATRQLFMMSLAASNGQLRVSTYGDDLTYTTADLRDDTWHHVALTYDGTSIKGYVDGSYVGVETNTLVNTTDNSPAIGNWNNAGFTFNGAISNVILYTETLTDANILTLYNNGSPQSTPYGSPFGWWKLDNTTFGIEDSGSGGNDGTLQNAPTETQTNVWTPRLNGESTTLPSTALVSSDLQFESPYSNFSLEFDGTDDYINTSLDTDSYSSFSVSAWVNGDDVNTYRTVASQTRYGNWANSSWLLYIEAGKMVFYIFSGGSIVQAGKDTALSAGIWYNIVATWDGTTSKLYINGVKETTEGSTSSMNTSTITTLIGAYNDSAGTGTAGYWNGKIDETAIWSSALTQAQISQVYNNGYPADLTSLSPVSWWRLGEDAYFVSPNFTVPNQITGAPNGTSANMDQADLVADAPGSYASGIGNSLVVTDRVGDAPESTANSLSVNMVPGNRISYPSGYVPTQVDNVYSMAFDGINDYFISALDGTGGSGSIIGLNSAADLSVSLWFKSSNTTPTGKGIFQWADTLSSGSPFMMIRQGSPGTTVDVYVDNAYVTTTIPIVVDTWYHITVTRSASDNIWRIYFDGEEYDTHNDLGTPNNQANADSIYLGNAYNGYFPGNIDEVAIFNYALSARQIKQDIYEGTTTGKTADLNNISNLTAPVAWYRMGD